MGFIVLRDQHRCKRKEFDEKHLKERARTFRVESSLKVQRRAFEDKVEQIISRVSNSELQEYQFVDKVP